jgi:hypothetical protein
MILSLFLAIQDELLSTSFPVLCFCQNGDAQTEMQQLRQISRPYHSCPQILYAVVEN